ncbi:MAG TPA: BON domain-containing protein [Chitinophagaceae bacterium]
MKKLSTTAMLLGIFALAISFNSCKKKMKDADIKAAIETALKADPMAANTTVSVDKGVATISGECTDDASKAHCAELVKAVKGVKEVVNNCTVAPAVAPPASLTTVLDDATQQKVRDGLKDIKGVSVEFSGDKAILSGEVTKADRMKIMQMLASAKVKSDVSKLMDKK